MISCGEAVQRLWDYLEQRLPPDHESRLEEHLALCRRCCGEAEFAHHLQLFLVGNATDALPGDVRERMERFLDHLEAAP